MVDVQVREEDLGDVRQPDGLAAAGAGCPRRSRSAACRRRGAAASRAGRGGRWAPIPRCPRRRSRGPWGRFTLAARVGSAHAQGLPAVHPARQPGRPGCGGRHRRGVRRAGRRVRRGLHHAADRGPRRQAGLQRAVVHDQRQPVLLRTSSARRCSVPASQDVGRRRRRPRLPRRSRAQRAGPARSLQTAPRGRRRQDARCARRCLRETARRRARRSLSRSRISVRSTASSDGAGVSAAAPLAAAPGHLVHGDDDHEVQDGGDDERS